jgi:Zn-finger nucleic acid-binding protein
MSENYDLKSLILTRTWHVPIAKKELFDAIVNELDKLFPPITYESWWFYQPAWNYSHSENYMDFSIKLEYLYILKNINASKPLYEQYQKLKAEFNKNVDKLIDSAPSIVSNGDPSTLHIDILKTDESGCEIEVTCHPFLYWNITNFKAKIDNMEKQHAMLTCERYLKTLAVGLNAKDIDKTESNLAKFSSFLGINENWMTSTYALQLQEVSITMVAQKKGIALDRENVERILNKEIKEKDFSFSHKYEALAKEVKRLYDIEIPFMAMWLRKMRQAVLHEGHNPTEQEKELAISATVCLLKELKKIFETETVTANDPAATDKK